jgi:hypothetical protein
MPSDTSICPSASSTTRRADPEFDHLYTELLDHVHALRRAAGYINARLAGGLVSRSTTRARHPTGSNYVSNGKVA